MIRRYAKTIKQLHTQLHTLKSDPYENNDLLLNIQETLVKKIKYVEARIREAKKLSDKEGAVQYQRVRQALTSIGDGLAFIYIDRWDVKAYARNNRPGFISGKAGFIKELKVLRGSIRNGPVLLADLTNCLRNGDIYAFSEDQNPLIIELKSSRGGSRARRQMKRLRRIVDYLNTDRAESTILKDQLLVRRSSGVRLVELVHDANAAISLAMTEGFGTVTPEEGVMYIVDNGENSQQFIGPLSDFDDPVVWYLNELKYELVDFVPFGLLIKDSESFVRFLEGSLLIMVVFDRKVITRKFMSHGIHVKYLDKTNWFMKLFRDKEDEYLEASDNFVGRVACEFLSLDWMIEELTWRHGNSYNDIDSVEMER